MGLGKTVELLTCIFAHRKTASEDSIFVETELQATRDLKMNLKRLKRERVECICGSVSESHKYKGLWVQCDMCDAWQHADCVGYSSKGKTVKSKEVSDGRGKMSAAKIQNHTQKKKATTIVVRDGEHICRLCTELIQATDSPIATGATLIVCPAPILPQWHDEIVQYVFCLKCCLTNLSIHRSALE